MCSDNPLCVQEEGDKRTLVSTASRDGARWQEATLGREQSGPGCRTGPRPWLVPGLDLTSPAAALTDTDDNFAVVDVGSLKYENGAI